MKKLILTFILGATFLSCSSDDDSNANNSNGISVDGSNYTITDAKAVDNYNFFSETHAEFNFILASSNITISAEPGSFFGFETDNAKFALDLSIAALGTTFQNGVYQYDENFGFDDPEFNYFDGLTVYIDGNQDGQYTNPEVDKIFVATGGTVTVSGTAPNYILAINVTLNNNQNLNFTYNQGFDYVDNRN
jgi:hypothetical protein